MTFEDELRLAMAAKAVELEGRAPDVAEIERRASQNPHPTTEMPLAHPVSTGHHPDDDADDDDDDDDEPTVALLPVPPHRRISVPEHRDARSTSRRPRRQLAQSGLGLVAAAAVIVIVGVVTLGPGSPDTDVFITPAERADVPPVLDENDRESRTEDDPTSEIDHEVQQVEQSDRPAAAMPLSDGEPGDGGPAAPPATVTPTGVPTPTAIATPAPIDNTAIAGPTAGPTTTPSAVAGLATATPTSPTTASATPTPSTPIVAAVAPPTVTPTTLVVAPTTTPTTLPTTTPTPVPTTVPTPAQNCPDGELLWNDGRCYPIPGATPTATVSSLPGTLQCPFNATEVNGECREAIAMHPGPKTCEQGFTIIDQQCALLVASTVDQSCTQGVRVTSPTLACAVTSAAVDVDETTGEIVCPGGEAPNATGECIRYENVVVTIVCSQNGTLVDGQCLVFGAPPVNGPATCPAGPGIIADPCYRIVDPVS